MAYSYQDFAQKNLTFLEQACRLLDRCNTRMECDVSHRTITATLKIITRGIRQTRKKMLRNNPQNECIYFETAAINIKIAMGTLKGGLTPLNRHRIMSSIAIAYDHLYKCADKK